MKTTKQTAIRTIIAAAALAASPLAGAEDASNLLYDASTVKGFNIYPAAAAATAKDVADPSAPGAKAIQVTITEGSKVGNKLSANLINKTFVPVLQGTRVRCSFSAKGTGAQSATVVLYYLNSDKQQITGVWPQFPTGLQLAPDWRDYSISYTIQGEDEDPAVTAVVNEKAGGVVSFLNCAILIEGEGTAEIADLKLSTVE